MRNEFSLTNNLNNAPALAPKNPAKTAFIIYLRRRFVVVAVAAVGSTATVVLLDLLLRFVDVSSLVYGSGFCSLSLLSLFLSSSSIRCSVEGSVVVDVVDVIDVVVVVVVVVDEDVVVVDAIDAVAERGLRGGRGGANGSTPRSCASAACNCTREQNR